MDTLLPVFFYRVLLCCYLCSSVSYSSFFVPLHQGARSMGFGKGQTECVGELPPRGYPGGAGGRSAPVGEALTSLLYWSA